MAWHPSTCAQLDLTWNDDRPGCRRCDQWGPQPTITQPQPPPAPPPDTKRSELYCTWPPCIKFVGDHQMSLQQGALKLLEDQATLRLLPHVLDILKSLESGAKGSDCPSHTGKPVPAESPPSLAASTIYGRLPTNSSIRLLCLHGNSLGTAPLHCSVEVHRLSDPACPVFEALSYTWADASGDNSLSRTIYVGTGYEILPVTHNCWTALRKFRTKTDRLLWVDAICINQNDQRERATQVSLMSRIFSSAARVLMYVGEGDVVTEGVMAALAESTRSVINANALVNLRQILCRPFFMRTWIVQEIKLAHRATLTVGNITADWESFRHHVLSSRFLMIDGHPKTWVEHDISSKAALQASRPADRNVAQPFQQIPPSQLPQPSFPRTTQQVKAAPAIRSRLLDVLFSTRNCRCGDPRDQVYAVLGLATDEPYKLPIDYSITVQQLYTGLAFYWLAMQDYRFLEAISPKRSVPNLPSWVPDWTSIGDLKSLSPSLAPAQIFTIDVTGTGESKTGLDWSERGSRSPQRGLILRHLQAPQPTPQPTPQATPQQPYNVYMAQRADRTGAFRGLLSTHGKSLSAGKEVGFLVVDAFQIFSIQSKMDNELPLHKDRICLDDSTSPSRLVYYQEGSEHDGLLPYIILPFRKGYLLRQHGQSIFSIEGSYDISSCTDFFTTPSPVSHGPPPPPPPPPGLAPPPPGLAPRSFRYVPSRIPSFSLANTASVQISLAYTEIDAVNCWLMALFFFGSRSGSGVPNFNLYFERQAWLKQFPKASDASITCRRYRYVRGNKSQLCSPEQFRNLTSVRQEILQFLSEDSVEAHEDPTKIQPPETIPRENVLFWDLYGAMPPHQPGLDSADTLDELLSFRVKDTCAAIDMKSASSFEHLIADWSSRLGQIKTSCKEYGPLDKALEQVLEDKTQPQFLAVVSYGLISPGYPPPPPPLPPGPYYPQPGLYPPSPIRQAKRRVFMDTKNPYVDTLSDTGSDSSGENGVPGDATESVFVFLAPLLGNVERSNKAYRMSITWIIQRACAILSDLRLGPDLSLEQNCDLIWIHIATLELVARLREILHYRRIAKCFDDAAKNVEKIALI